MNQQDILALISAFKEADIGRMHLRDGEFSLKLEKSPKVVPGPSFPAGEMPMFPGMAPMMQMGHAANLRSPAASFAEPTAETTIEATKSEAQAASQSMGEPVKAPLVGVYYQAPSPDAEPFVREDQHVNKGDTLCVIEAMKMMNEVQAPMSGTVTAIFGKNGALVEFDQVLFTIRPDVS